MKILLLLLCAVLVHAEDLATPPISPLLPDAVKLLAAADKDVAEIDGKALAAKYELYNGLIPKLVKAQETATKAGKLEAAQAAKAKVEEYKAKVAEIVSLRKPAAAPLVLSGTYAFNFVGSGHMGTLELKSDTAKEVKTNIRGGLTQNGNEYVILWSNNTQWAITRTDSDLTVSSSDGESKLTKISK